MVGIVDLDAAHRLRGDLAHRGDGALPGRGGSVTDALAEACGDQAFCGEEFLDEVQQSGGGANWRGS